MRKTAWLGSHNPLRAAMEASIGNALNIATYTRNALHAYKNNPDPGFALLFDETDLLYNTLLEALGKQGGDGTIKFSGTGAMKTAYKDMCKMLNGFDDKIRPFFGKNTLEYLTVWGKNRNRFYRGSYELRETALKEMAESMSKYPLLNAITQEVTDYYNTLKAARQLQQGSISSFKFDYIKVYNAIEDLIVQQDRNLGWLKFFYARHPEAEKKVNAFFDLRNIASHMHKKTYSRHIPSIGYVKLCRHGFKATELIKITVDQTADVYLYLVPVGKTDFGKYKSFKVEKGTSVEKRASEIFSDLTYKQVIVASPMQ
jgi:hypothetical protein